MKVTDIKTFAVDCFRTNWVFVKVYTDEGIDGVGEATLEYKEKALIGAVEHIKEYLVDKNPLDIEKHWHDIYAVFLPVNGVGNNMNMTDAKRFCERVNPKFAVPLHCGMFDNIDMNKFGYENKAVPKIYEEIKI